VKVGKYYSNTDIRIEELPIPKIEKKEILIKVLACGICGSDVMEWYRKPKAPKVLGHEVAGEIVEVGEEVKNWQIGDKVFVSHHVPCEKCEMCKKGHHTLCETLRRTNFYPGGFSEYLRVPRINVEKGTFILPESISPIEATFIEPLGCVIRGARRIGIEEKDTILIIGGGVSGILYLKLTKLLQVNRVFVVDVNDYRLKTVQKFNPTGVIDGKKGIKEELLNLTNNELPDKVIVCTNALSAIEESFHCVKDGGRILFFAPTPPGVTVRIPFFEMWKKQIVITSTYAAVKRDIQEAITLIQHKKIKIKDMITHILPLEEINYGFKLVIEGGESLKVIITP
jgi:L-iditol 2-dehydrogenase